MLFRAGDQADVMYVVMSGTLDIVLENRIVAKSTRGDLIGEMALIDQSPRSATVVASETCTLAKLDQARFQRLIQLNPFFATHVMKVLVDRIRRSEHEHSQKPKA